MTDSTDGRDGSARDVPIHPDMEQWIAAQLDPSSAQACIRYALAFNTLDVGWLDGALSPFVTYESQSVFEKMSGRDKVFAYLESKIETLRRNRATRPRFELANTQTGEPCAAGFQPQGAFDRNWLAVPLTSVVFRVDEQGLISGILIITVAPAPATAIRSGHYPGAGDDVRERPR